MSQDIASKNIRVNRRATEIKEQTIRDLRKEPKTQVNVAIQPALAENAKDFLASIRKAADEEQGRAKAAIYTNSEWPDFSYPGAENAYPLVAVLYQVTESGARRQIKETTFAPN